MEFIAAKRIDGETITKLFDNCFGNIFITDSKGIIVYLNTSSAQSLGIPRDELVGMSVFELKSRQIVSDTATDEVLRTKKPVVRSVNCRNTDFNLAVVCNPVFDDNGEIAFTVTYSQSEAEINKILENVVQERQKLKQALSFVTAETDIVAESIAFQGILRQCQRIASTSSTVFLRGESGTGKEVVAKYIHACSDRRDEIFLPVNCGAIPADLMESEFFGYEKGAFTGANREGRAGLFEMAERGTIFLDEIGELPLAMQSKLLRVLDTDEIIRIGGNKFKKVNVRVIAATNRDIWKMVQELKFREDLFYRLNVIPLLLPALRDRPEDIPALIDHYLERYNRKYQAKKVFSPQTVETFLAYHWPGNVRELKNVVERLVVSSTDDMIHITNISPRGSQNEFDGKKTIFPGTAGQGKLGGNLEDTLRQVEAECIRRALRECGNHVPQAAARLGLHRSALYKKINKYHIELGK